MKQTLRLNADVKNTKFDGRARYGLQSIKTISAGAFVVDTEWRTWVLMPDTPPFGINQYEAQELQDAIRSSSSPCEPETLGEVMLATEQGFSGADMAAAVLDLLFRAGKVSRQDVESAIADWMKE